MTRACRMLSLLTGLIITSTWVSATAASRGTDIRIQRALLDEDRGTAEVLNLRYAPPAGVDAVEAAHEVLAARYDLYKLQDPRSELQLVRRTSDRNGSEHLRLRQYYNGLRVWGCEQIAHVNAAGELYMIAGQTIPTPAINTTPRIDASFAASKAIIAIRDTYPDADLATTSELLIYPDGPTPRLAYAVEVTGTRRGDIRWQVMVDALSGEVLLKYNDIHEDGPAVGAGLDVNSIPHTIQTYQIGSDFYLIDATQPMFVPPVTNHEGVIITYDNYYNNGEESSVIIDPNGDNNFDDDISLRAAVAGHVYAQLSYEYFLNTFGRNSYDDLGSTIRVNVHDPKYINNAYWNGFAVNFADGDGSAWRPWSGALDVVAHELTHGVIDYTADLIYMFQSGALNESYSDFFSAMVDRDDWLLGEEIRITWPGFVRNLQDPHQGRDTLRFSFGYQPAHIDEFVKLPVGYDNGGVHINSGIPNRAGYVAATASSREAAEQIWYHTLANYLTQSSDFGFWAQMTFQSAVDLYGGGSPEVAAVAEALDSVGLGGLAVISAELENLSVALGGTLDTLIQFRNLSAQTVNLLSASGGVPELSIGLAFPVSVGSGASITVPITFDANALTEQCDVREWTEGIVFETDAASTPMLYVPVTVAVGYSGGTEQASSFPTTLTTLTALNNASILDYDVMYSGGSMVYPTLGEATLMIGLVDDTTKRVYRNIYGRKDFVSVDDFAAGVDTLNRSVRTVRIATADGRIHGEVRYTYPEIYHAGLDYHIIDYTLTNVCDTPLTILVAAYADFRIAAGNPNYAGYDATRDLVYMYQAQGSITSGWAFLSGKARNLRAVDNRTVVWDWHGFTDEDAYDEMHATTNVPGDTGNDWSVLLTLGEPTLGAGESVTYTTAMMYSGYGVSRLEYTVDALKYLMCEVELTGDVNVNGTITSADIIYTVNYIFKGGPEPLPAVEAADVNCDRVVTSADVIYLVNFIFKSNAAPCDVCANF